MRDQELVAVMKALSDEKRFRMVQEIAQAGELSCGELGEKLELSQPTVSHHLKLLSQAGLLVARREGQHHLVSVNQAFLARAFGLLLERLPGASRRAPTGRPTSGRSPDRLRPSNPAPPTRIDRSRNTSAGRARRGP